MEPCARASPARPLPGSLQPLQSLSQAHPGLFEASWGSGGPLQGLFNSSSGCPSLRGFSFLDRPPFSGTSSGPLLRGLFAVGAFPQPLLQAFAGSLPAPSGPLAMYLMFALRKARYLSSPLIEGGPSRSSGSPTSCPSRTGLLSPAPLRGLSSGASSGLGPLRSLFSSRAFPGPWPCTLRSPLIEG